MKRILTFFLALTMVLSLAACGGKADDNKGKTEVTMTAQEIMDTLKEKLGDSFGCDVAETEDNIGAAIALGEATATALKNGHANGETEAALQYAQKIKHEQKDFLTEQGIHAIY